MFNRKIIHKLLIWKDSTYRKPLILRGARQVGKTTVVHAFSKHFSQYIYLNLEKAEDKEIFTDKGSTQEIIDALFFLKDSVQNRKDTLIFIDEVQEVPEAISALRYFYEEYPQYHVIAAGSLLEAVFNKKTRFPVGRVEYLELFPFSFEEFLQAAGEQQALALYKQVPPPGYAHDKLLQLFHTYTLIGGMPEVIKVYVAERDLVALKPVYESLLVSYMDDVEKYARNQTLTQVMRHAIPSCFREAGARIRFHGFGSSVYGSREMGEALRTLEKAKLCYLLYPTTQTQPPFMPDVKKSPRLQVVDTGMLNYFAGMQKEVFAARDMSTIYNGRIIEHIVGQEFITIKESILKNILFWVREKEGTTSELDFLFVDGGKAIPVEIKAGKAGTLRSLHQYIDRSGASLAIRLYAGNFQENHLKTISGTPFTLLNIPYYQAGVIKKYVDYYRKQNSLTNA